MLSILLVEDSAEKQKSIAAAVASVPGCSVDDLELVPSVSAARKALAERQFDLMLLDLHLPNKLGDEAESEAGLRLLETLRSGTRLKLPFHVIAVTACEEARELSKRELELQLWGTIAYDARDLSWRDVLRNKLAYLVSSKQALAADAARTHLVTLGVVTALYEELEATLEQGTRWTERRYDGDSTIYHEGVFENGPTMLSVVAATSARMGMAAAATLASKMTARYRPRYLAMAGIAAGIPGKTNLGDVLIADPSWDWGSGKFEVKKGRGRFTADPEQLRINRILRGKLDHASNDRGFLHSIREAYKGPRVTYDLSAHVGGVASGAAVVGDAEVVASIVKQKRKLVGVEMEVFGVMTAADSAPEPRPLAFSAKSVSDYADSDKDDKNRHYATFTSARFIREFSLEYLT